MEGHFLSPPAKRSFHNFSSAMQDNTTTATTTTTTTTNNNNNPYYNTNGASKRRSKRPQPPLVVPYGHVAFRLLCHASKIGGVIGKSGSIVKLFQQETGAKIRVEDPINDCDERLILIVAPENPKKKIRLKRSNEEEDRGSEEEEQQYDVSPAQEALVKVFDRVLDVDAEMEGIFPLPAAGGVVSCRILADTTQIGSVIGKGGKIVEKIRKESGAKIRVLPAEQLPDCASPTDEVIQILGGVLPVKKALVAISRCLQDNPPLDRAQMGGNIPSGTASGQTFPDPRGDFSHRNNILLLDKAQMVGSIPSGPASGRTFPDPRGDFSHRNSILPPAAVSSVDYASRGRPLSTEVDRISMLDPVKTQQEVAFRLLCSNDKVGGVIGKGGTIVRALQNETGASISVASPATESDERVITVSASETPESQYSPAQNAVVRVFTRSVEVGVEKGLESGSNKGAPVAARLLVSSNQIGCLMGKGGTIISEMRKATGAGIRIIGGDQVPKCASENEEVVQISGELRNVQDALFHVTGRLRDNLFPNRVLNNAEGRSYSSSTIPEIGPYGRVREPHSPGLYPSVGPSHNLDRQASLTQSMVHLGLSHNLDRPPSPRLWSSQTVGGGSSRSTMDIGRGTTSRRGGLELVSGSKSAVVTNTTVEIVVPAHVLGSIYGENGSNLSRLRQISGAKVTVNDPRPGTDEGMVIISGTPDQTQAAQSLLQAFIISGRS
ncbi:K Homology domain [Macleaya cordata]|uniref:K Homology domain n=1 Tax=Macleaya cordata TaxID=56857 RepID=A0A200PNH2_MACCD|nr:K Homology domain [Macleaya cordata]